MLLSGINIGRSKLWGMATMFSEIPRFFVAHCADLSSRHCFAWITSHVKFSGSLVSTACFPSQGQIEYKFAKLSVLSHGSVKYCNALSSVSVY